MKVYQCISAVQKRMASDGITKARKNQQQGYSFRGIDDVLNALSPVLADLGLCVLPRMLSRECVERQTKSGGALFYVTVEAEFDFVAAEDGSKHTVKTYGEAMDSADKATNKAMSAAYKYAAILAFAIPTEGDNDADSSSHEVLSGKPAAHTAPVDDSPKATAGRITAGVVKGDTAGAAQFMSAMPKTRLDAVWAMLDAATQDKLTAAWPNAA